MQPRPVFDATKDGIIKVYVWSFGLEHGGPFRTEREAIADFRKKWPNQFPRVSERYQLASVTKWESEQ